MARRVVVFNNAVAPYTSRFYDAVLDEGIDIVMLSCSREEPIRSWARDITPRYRHRVLPGLRLRLGEGRYAYFNVGIVKTLNELAPDLLIINGIYPSMLLAAAWARVTRIPLMLVTDGWQATMPDSLYHRLIRPLILRQCAGIICCSQKGVDYVRAQGVAEARIFNVPLVPAWDPPNRVADAATRPYHLLWCARMTQEAKNILFFVDVAIALKQRIADLRVRLVGRGRDAADAIERLIRAGIACTHDEAIEWHRMPDVYASARLLLLPSTWEPWGLVCNEALQCGVPCLVSPLVGAADDLVVSGQTGYVLPLEQAQWVQTAARILAAGDEWTRLSNAGRAASKSRGLAAAARTFVETLEQTLTSSAKAHHEARTCG